MHPSSIRRIGIAVVAVGIVAAVATSVVGFVLADVYRPPAPLQELATAPPEVRRSADWSDRHGMASAVLVVAGAATLVVLLLVARRQAAVARRGMAVAFVASGVALAAAALTVVTRPLVEWEQVALRPVTVGDGLDGYWFAAFDDDVLFAIVDGTEVSQGRYTVGMLAHLGAPVIAAVALLVVAAVLARQRATPTPTDA